MISGSCKLPKFWLYGIVFSYNYQGLWDSNIALHRYKLQKYLAQSNFKQKRRALQYKSKRDLCKVASEAEVFCNIN